MQQLAAPGKIILVQQIVGLSFDFFTITISRHIKDE